MARPQSLSEYPARADGRAGPTACGQRYWFVIGMGGEQFVQLGFDRLRDQLVETL